MLLKVGAAAGRILVGYAIGYALGEGIDKAMSYSKKRRTVNE